MMGPQAFPLWEQYGIPASTNLGRFQFTGQTWLPEVGLYYYKARMYSPTLGRFMQTDPIGYADGMNWYAYVGNDPVNYVDPLGLAGVPRNNDIVVTAPSYRGLRGALGARGRNVGVGSRSLLDAIRGNRAGLECDWVCELNREMHAHFATLNNVSDGAGESGGGGGTNESIAQAHERFCQSNPVAARALRYGSVQRALQGVLARGTLSGFEYAVTADARDGAVSPYFTSMLGDAVLVGDALLPDGSSFPTTTDRLFVDLVLIHSHQQGYNRPLSGGDGDLYISFTLGITVIAIDAGGRVYCSPQN